LKNEANKPLPVILTRMKCLTIVFSNLCFRGRLPADRIGILSGFTAGGNFMLILLLIRQ